MIEGIISEYDYKASHDQQPRPIRPLGVKRHYTITPMTPIDEINYSELMVSPDDMLNRIGFGKYQIICYLIFGLLLINDGAEIIVTSFLIAILEREWELSYFNICVLSSFTFGGVITGTMMSDRISYKFGRKNPLILAVFLIYIFAMLSAYVESFVPLLVVRTVFNLLTGFQISMCSAFLREITPPKFRGKGFFLFGGFLTIGKIFACIAAYFTLSSANSGDWGSLFIWIAQPTLIAFFLLIFYVKESPRYIARRDAEAGIDSFQHILKVNSGSNVTNEEIMSAEHNKGQKATEGRRKSRQITLKYKVGLQNWLTTNQSKDSLDRSVIVKDLLTDRYKRISLNIWVIWLILSVVYYGIMIVLPIMFAKLGDSNDYFEQRRAILDILLTVFAELPSFAIGYVYSERQITNKRKFLVTGLFIGGVACAITIFFTNFGVVLWIALARFSIDGCLIIAAPYTAELYPPNIRSIGLDVARIWRRIGGMIMPWITFSLIHVDALSPFLVYAILCIIAAICVFIIPETPPDEQESHYREMGSISKDGRDGSESEDL